MLGMADVLRLIQKDHLFGNVDGMISYAFQTFGDDH